MAEGRSITAVYGGYLPAKFWKFSVCISTVSQYAWDVGIRIVPLNG